MRIRKSNCGIKFVDNLNCGVKIELSRVLIYVFIIIFINYYILIRDILVKK